MDTLQASLEGQTRSSAPNPNLDSDKTSSSLSNYEQAVQAAEISSPSSLHIVTPLVYSEILSEKTGHNIFLKLDALQPSGSFKIRGIGRVCQVAVERYGSSAHLICSSGGNAGLAAATAAKSLGVRCSVYVPETCEEAVKETLRGLKAEVIVAGPVWDTCDQAARKAVEAEDGAVYIHPFEGDDLVDGHSSIVEEIYQQVAESSQASKDEGSAAVPDMIVSAVGGGGFLAGILRGISRRQSQSLSSGGPVHSPKLVGVQDFGADGFSQSMNAYHDDPIGNADAHITLPAITSLATSMGARKCSALTLKLARKYARYGTLDDSSIAASGSGSGSHTEAECSTRHGKYFAGVVVEDAISGSATWQINRDHQIMVEIACGAALAPAYQSERLLSKLVGFLPRPEGRKNIVLIACGGSKIDQAMLEKYEKSYGLQEGAGRIEIDGQAI
jgi:L-serine/L-threonine ammonia-lyase